MDDRIGLILADLRRRLGDLYGSRLERLVLFGSQARGDADAGSDIDVLVVLTGPVAPAEEVSRTIDTVAALSLEHDVVVGCVFVSGDDFEQAGSPFLRNARREGVTV
jgi:predicted nucleotidyltransferase